MKKYLITILLMCAFFTLFNNSEDQVLMSLRWVDHNYKNYPQPAIVMMADLEAGKSFDGAADYPGRIFICTSGERFKQFKIFPGNYRAVCEWDGEKIILREER